MVCVSPTAIGPTTVSSGVPVGTAIADLPDVAHVLDELFTLCRIPFVTDFMFTPDAVADISMLTSPVQSEHAVAARIRISAEDSGSPDSIGASNFGWTDDFLFCTIPAFSVGPITVGFCILRQTGLCSSSSLTDVGDGTINSNHPHASPHPAASQPVPTHPPPPPPPPPIPPSAAASCGADVRASSNNNNVAASDGLDDIMISSPASTPCNRFVRDDRRGILLVVADKPASNTMELDCMIHRSSRRRTRVRARFRADALRASLQSAHGVLHPPVVIPSLCELSVAYERRRCPLCGAGESNVECACSLPFRRPSHPLDFRHERCNMSLYTGRYSGSTTLRLFTTSGVSVIPYAVTDLNSQSVIKGSTDRSVIDLLTRHAVQQRLATLNVHPLASVVSSPFPSSLSSTAPAATTPATAGVPHSSPFVMASGKAPFSMAVPSYNPSCTDGFADAFSAPSAQTPRRLDSRRQQCDALDSLLTGLDAAVGNIPDGSSNAPSDGSAETPHDTAHPMIFDTRPTPTTNKRSALTYVDNGDGGDADGDGDNDDDNDDGGGGGDGFSTDESSGKTTCALPHLGIGSGSIGDRDNKSDTGIPPVAGGIMKGSPLAHDEKAAKAEIRRQRNRMAAARSNIKRKIRNEKLRKDLSEVKKRAAELREREKCLRAENVRLRSMANERKVKVSLHLTHIQMNHIT